MALIDNEARILDSLRPIFPQLNDRVLYHCIRNVRETVGSDPASIIPGCIDALLAGQTFPEVAVAQQRPTVLCIPSDDGDYRGNSRFQNDDDDDVIFVARNSRSPKTASHVINLIEEPEITVYSGSSALNNSTLSSPRSQNASNATEPKGTSLSRSTFLTATTATTTSTIHVAAQEPREIQSTVVHIEPPSLDPMEEALQNLLSLFPDVEGAYLQSLLDKWSHVPPHEAVNNACDELLEKKDFPRKSPGPSVKVTSPIDDQKEKDYFKDFSTEVSSKFRHQCCQLLQNEFRMIPMKDIRLALAKFKGHYAPSKVYLQELLRVSSVSNGTAASTTSLSQGTNAPQSSALQTISTANQGFYIPPKITLLKNGRSPVGMFLPSQADKELQKEIDFVRNYELSKSEERDRMLAVSLNNEQYEEEGQKIECGCCYGDAAFEDMVQCLEGHLFCASCLMNYAKEATFGQGKATLSCMTDGCDGNFPLSQLKKALPTNILEKYEDRVKDEALLLAQMDDFVQCPSCDFGAILPPEDKVFKCQNPSCAKETCRYCKEVWSEHFGLKCKEVEKTAQKDVRLSYEEKMTMAKIRKCPKCGCEFTKSDGCNKMTCRCGTTMCYVCRKPKISYNHFCQHPKDPGKSCTKCTSCSLWSDPSEDDNRAVKELEKEALEVKRKFEAESMGLEDNPAKKVKTN